MLISSLPKKLAATLASTFLLIGTLGAPATAAPTVELEGSAWYPSYGADTSLQSHINSYRMWLLGEEAGSYSHLVAFSLDGSPTSLCQDGNGAGVVGVPGAGGVGANCDTTALAEVDGDENSIRDLSAQLVLPPCSVSGVDENLCIESVYIYESGTTRTAATFDSQTPGPIVAAQESIGLRKGSTMSLWDSSWNHAGGTGKYLVNAVVKAYAFRDAEESQLSYEGLRITVTPVEEVVEQFVGTVTLATSGPALVEENKEADRCGYTSGAYNTETGRCGRNHNFAANTQVEVSVRVPSEVGGFFKGRMENPDISVTPRAGHSGTQIITASGSSTIAPRVLGSLPYCIMPGGADVDPIKDCEGAEANGGTLNPQIAALPDDMAQRAQFEANGFGVGSLYQDTDSGTLEFINWAKEQNNDTATALQSLWSFSTMGFPSFDECLADTSVMHGIVTTNAMAYTDSPPSLDESGNLTYLVAGMHLMPDGVTEVSGSYHLILNRTTADCLYGDLGESPTATVSIIDDSNEAKTSQVAFSVDSDWLKLSATGFTFSQNTISVSLAPAVASNPPSGNSPAIIVPVTTPPAAITPPVIPAGQSGAVLIGGVPANVTISPNALSKALEIKGSDWSLGLTPDSAGTSPLNAKGELVLNPQGTTDLAGTGFQANSKASAFLIPRGGLTVAALGMTQANLRASNTASLNLGEIAVGTNGAFNANLDLTGAKPGDYILQINGAAPDGKIRSISVAANVLDVALKGWTKKLTNNQAKVYVKNVVAGGKVQIFVNGKEIAWVNAIDETDPKLRKANGFNYLVRTINLVPGKNRVEIKVDGERERFTTYTR